MKRFGDYPVYEKIAELKKDLQLNSTVVFEASPGAGKSTLIPLELKEEDWLPGKKIVMLQPRKIAVKNVANRMSDLLEEPIGQTIGYSIRFEKKSSEKTKIEVITEGILLRLIQNDFLISDIGLVIFDEFHERNIFSEVSFSVCRYIQNLFRPDLKILIMSATLEGKTRRWLSQFPFLSCEGRQFPVKIHYEKTDVDENISLKCARKIIQVLAEKKGDLLVFLPGEGEIKKTASILIENQCKARIHPLYGALNYQDQLKAILPNENGERKIILSTPVAETSLTIEGVTTVIDSGLVKRVRYDAERGISRLETVAISIDSADQRAGRAGRLVAGDCYRLWTTGNHHQLNQERKSELLEADLSPFLLQLLQIGIENWEDLNWIDAPPDGHYLAAKKLLEKLELIENGKLSEIGKKCLRFGTHPRFAKMLCKAEELDEEFESTRYRNLAIDLIAILEEKDILPKEEGCDLSLRIEKLKESRKEEARKMVSFQLEKIENVCEHWRKLLRINLNEFENFENEIGLLLAFAFPDRIAKRSEVNSEIYKLENGITARMNSDDSLRNEEWIVIPVLEANRKNNLIKLACTINSTQFTSLSKLEHKVYLDEEKLSLVSIIEKKLGSFVIQNTPGGKIEEENRIRLFSEFIRKKGLSVLRFTEKEFNWMDKMHCLKKWNKEENWPDFSEEYLLQNLEQWLGPHMAGKNKFTEISSLPFVDIWKSQIGYEKAALADKLAPDFLKVPSDSKIPIRYFRDEREPEIKVRIQELFGLTECPRLNNGKQPLLIHLLSPGYKPVQLTKDLNSFWKNLYPQIKKELSRKYPKHYWPENPYEAEAVKGIKRKE